jgi:hypothetical protein
VNASTANPTPLHTTGSTPTADADWSLLLTACSQGPQREKLELIRSLGDTVRWKELWQLADRHNVQPLLCRALADAGDLVPPAEMRVLEKLRQTNLHKNLLLARELIRVVDHLAEAGIEVIPYKGVALAEFLYGDLALRHAGDIDLLIRVKDLKRVRESLLQLGYTAHLSFTPAQERAYLKIGYECAFDGTCGPNLIEVQWAVQPRFYAIDLHQDELFQRAITVTVAGHRMKALSPEDLFIVLSLHAAKHLWGRLIWLCDIARMMSVPTLNWDWIAKQSKKLGITQILRTRERATDRLRFVTRLAFTPGPGEWDMLRLPEPLFPLYHFVRFYRLGRKVVTS